MKPSRCDVARAARADAGRVLRLHRRAGGGRSRRGRGSPSCRGPGRRSRRSYVLRRREHRRLSIRRGAGTTRRRARRRPRAARRGASACPRSDLAVADALVARWPGDRRRPRRSPDTGRGPARRPAARSSRACWMDGEPAVPGLLLVLLGGRGHLARERALLGATWELADHEADVREAGERRRLEDALHDDGRHVLVDLEDAHAGEVLVGRATCFQSSRLLLSS